MKPSSPSRNADIQQLLTNNQAWAEEFARDNPGFLEHSATQQKPKFLWIGCADSRVAPDQILGLKPGEILVHRNIANLVRADDVNCQSVLEFAINVVGVEHIIVCGHYGCAGVATAMQETPIGGLIGDWLAPAQQFWAEHSAHEAVPKQNPRDYYCELNARRQALSVCHSVPVQQAWQQGQTLHVHAWVYQLALGRVQELGSATGVGEESKLGLPGI